MKSLLAVILLVAQFSLDDIIMDIYRGQTELGETDYEQLQTDLYALHESPINLNTATEEDLQSLYFLSPQQIDDILAFVGHHPMDSIYELKMIASLHDYEIRDMLPFVYVGEPPAEKTYWREMFARARHELIARTDARNIEGYAGTDPMYVQARYRFDARGKIQAGLQLRRPAGGKAEDLQYGGYIRLNDIGPLHRLVVGNMQASFGQGLVLAPVFHMGKTATVSQAGYATEGLRHYSSVDGESMHGIGATFRHSFRPQTRLDATVLYSLKRANDSVWQHVAGANLTLRHKQLQVGLTAIENIYSDSVRPYRNTTYNTHYFRGERQAVIGANVRYCHQYVDAFAEVAASQNTQWGVGVIAGSRFYPCQGLTLVALYRYYSPWFDNAWGYAFSETSRIGDEHGGYLGFEYTGLPKWRFSAYGDVFRFSGPKFGIPESPTMGFDAYFETQYRHSDTWWLAWRLRAREKGLQDTYSARLQFDWQQNGWSLRTTAEGNLTQDRHTGADPALGYGVTVYQDIGYSRSFKEGRGIGLHFRIQAFDARQWANRIYCYEHDVLYAFSNPAIYGLGGRAYLCVKWQIIPQLSLYCRVSETVYQKQWAADHDRAMTRTDVHLLLRAYLP